MQFAQCKVRLNGDLNNVVPKINVTPAEVATLIAIHGEGAVIEVQLMGSDRRSHRDEYDRLDRAYGAAPGGDDKSIFRTMWPNPLATQFPVNFSEVGISIPNESTEADDAATPPPKSGPKGAQPLNFKRPEAAPAGSD